MEYTPWRPLPNFLFLQHAEIRLEESEKFENGVYFQRKIVQVGKYCLFGSILFPKCEEKFSRKDNEMEKTNRRKGGKSEEKHRR